MNLKSGLLFQNLNAPIEFVDEIEGVELWIKREDKIHPFVSGNKWRKLKYYIKAFDNSEFSELLTFGGAFSNHIAAVAALGNHLNITTKAFIRGEEIKSNPTIDFCKRHGMKIIPVSREEYHLKDNKYYLDDLKLKYPNALIVPEGGKGVLGIRGCTEILEDVDSSFDVICCSSGTATTFSGLLFSGFESEFIMFPALKNADFLREDVLTNKNEYNSYLSTNGILKKTAHRPFSLEKDFHFGGYAKVDESLVAFMNSFYEKYGIPLDPVYTAKMMFGVMDGIKKGKFGIGTKILTIHTGGLQGIRGMNERLIKKNQNTILYEG